MKNKSQKNFTSVTSLIIIVGLLIFGAYYSVTSTKKDVNEQNKRYLSEIAVQNAYNVKTSVEGELDKLEAIANIISMQDELNDDYTMQILKAELMRGNFKRLGYINREGVASTTDNQTFSVLDREYYANALKGESCVSDVMIDKVGGGQINVYSVPLYHQGEITGAIMATNDTKIFSNVLDVKGFYGEGHSYIVKKDGTPVAIGSSEKGADVFENLFVEMQESNVSEFDINQMRDDIANNNGGFIEYSRDGVEKIGAYSKLGINDWYVMSVVSRDVIIKGADRLIYRSQVSAIFCAILLGGLIAFIVIENKKNSRKLIRLAYVDPLTGGNNLNKFKSLAKHRIEQNAEGLYMVRIDVDNFKFINDMYGYNEGDEILISMYQMISTVLQKRGVCCRSNNDNFLCLLYGNSDEDILETGAKFRKEFKHMLMQQGKKYVVNFTTGVYRIPEGERDIEKMIDRATMAHRKAKQLSFEKKSIFYSNDIWEEAAKVKDIEDVMHHALAKGEFAVYLQPKYNLFTGKLVGAEALTRWIRNGKIIPPSEFIPIFQKNGFIVNLDMYVWEEVCKMQRNWLDKGMNPVPISVNQSKALIYESDYVEMLSSVVLKQDLPPQLIELELLESIIYDNVDDLKILIERLQQRGFRVCLDDFGSGYSSLNLIKDICPDVLKIDREFLGSAENNVRGEVVLSNIIRLARGLDMSIVVEGVETQAQAELLKRLKCNVVQGYLFAKPMPIAEYEQKLCKEL